MQIEWDYYIPPDVTLYSDGTIEPADMDDVYSFTDNSRRVLMSFTGWGMPGIDLVTQRGPYQHGRTLINYRLEPRVIQYVYRNVGGCRDDYWDNRSALINAIRPNRGVSGCISEGRLRKILRDGTIRDLMVFIERGPLFEPRGTDWDEWSFTETIRFVANNPIVFNPIQNSATWAIGAPTGELIFPAVFPIFFGPAIINETIDVTYNGTWMSFPVITITGPLSGPIIENESTNETISIGWNIPAGKTLVIDLAYGVKSIIDSDGVSRIGTVSTNSDLATFHIASDPEVAGGVNTLRVSGASATVNTAIVITWYDRYIGI